MSSVNKILIKLHSNQSEKGHIFQSCQTMRQDDQFSVQLNSSDHWTQLEPTERPKGNETVSVEEMLVQGSLLAPGMEIPANQAKQTTVTFIAKYGFCCCCFYLFVFLCYFFISWILFVLKNQQLLMLVTRKYFLKFSF